MLPVLLLTQACDEDGGFFSSRPDGVLSKKEMISLMVDIHLEEASLRSDNHQFDKDEMRNYTRGKYLKVFANHGVKPDDFRKSLDYYLLRVSDLDDIYTGVINRLTEMQSELQGSEAKPPEKKVVPSQYKKPDDKNVLKTPSGK
jgi:hypothetical protein